jgi:LPXTG-site transpeptidase (sortase) family protein
MKYNYEDGIERRKSRKWVLLPVVGLLGGAYMLVNALAPAAPDVFSSADTTAKKLVSLQPTLSENRIYVPKINVDVAVVPVEGNESLALEKGAVQRAPGSGDPKEGGNYVVAAHRFNLGFTPAQTRAKSPFYHINKLSSGDDIYVDYKGKRYAYKVTERRTVEPTAVEIEARTDDDRLTMYSCELAGPEAGREVVIAKPVGTIVWQDGKPRLKAL